MVAGVLLVVTAVAGVLLTPPAGESAPAGFPSSYSTASDGAKAAFLLLQELDYDAKRWANPPNQLPNPGKGTILILADPFLPGSADEKWQVEQFIRSGGRVLITGTTAGSLLPAADLKAARELRFGWQDFPAQLPGPISQQGARISMKARARWGNQLPNYVAYYGDDQGATVVRAALGDGEIIWWADSSPLTNYGLTRAANLRLFLNCVGPPQRYTVLWDEHFHGMRAGLWDYLGRTPVPWAVAQLSILFFAVILTYSRRSGPVAVHQEESRLSPLEFVETVGDLYERKRDAAGALEVAFQRFRFLLERRLGLAPTSGFEALDRAIEARGGWPHPGLRATLKQCEAAIQGGRLNNLQALALVQALYDAARRLRLGRMGG
jgi:hypothetical protein